jgi:F0F1-type ATP synthase assembly protein I
MIFSRNFFIVAGVLGAAFVGISLDPGLVGGVLGFGYARFFSLHFWGMTLALLIGFGLLVALKSRKGKKRDQDDDDEPPADNRFHSSHPFNK